MTFTYGQMKTERDRIEAECDKFGEILQSFPKGAMNLTSNETKASEEYKYARKSYDLAFMRLRNINQYMTKHFSKEMKAERDARRASRLTPAT